MAAASTGRSRDMREHEAPSAPRPVLPRATAMATPQFDRWRNTTGPRAAHRDNAQEEEEGSAKNKEQEEKGEDLHWSRRAQGIKACRTRPLVSKYRRTR
mgnify:CR=1 FL=1